jgi:hypothetical protein
MNNNSEGIEAKRKMAKRVEAYIFGFQYGTNPVIDSDINVMDEQELDDYLLSAKLLMKQLFAECKYMSAMKMQEILGEYISEDDDEEIIGYMED